MARLAHPEQTIPVLDVEPDGVEGAILAVLDSVAADVESIDYQEDLGKELVAMRELHERYFSSATDPNGTGWAPLAPSTVRRKGRDDILIDKGAMLRSLATEGGDNIGEVHRAGGDNHQFVLFGTNDENAPRHQRGTSKMPARPPVGLTTQFVDAMTERVADATVKALNR